MNPPSRDRRLVHAMARQLRSARAVSGSVPRTLTPRLVPLPAWATPQGAAPAAFTPAAFTPAAFTPAPLPAPIPSAATPVPLGTSGMTLVVEPGLAGLARELSPGVYLVAGVDARAVGEGGNVLAFIPGIVSEGLKGLSNLALTIASFWPKSGAREQIEARREAELQARIVEQTTDPAYVLANMLAQQQAAAALAPTAPPATSPQAAMAANAASASPVGCAGCACTACGTRR